MPKVDEFRLVLATYLPDLACLTETWLTSEIDNDWIKADGFTCVRSDRIAKRGGGTAIYIRDGIPFDYKDVSEQFNRTAEGILLELHKGKISVLCVYIPPSLSADSLAEIRDGIVSIADDYLTRDSSNKIMIVGDFNHFRVDRLTSDLDLVDIVQEPTREKRILDHVLVSSELLNVYKPDCISYNPPIGKADHKTLIATPLNQPPSSTEARYKAVYDFRDSNVMNLLRKANEMDWEDISSAKDVDDMWKGFI